MQIAGIERNSIVDGPGIRTVIYFSGCDRGCIGCHASIICDFEYGRTMTAEELIAYVEDDMEFIDGLTLSGGDPVYQSDEVCEFITMFKSKYPEMTIMMYTGEEFENIPQKLKSVVDYVMDGIYKKFESHNKKWRGSDNQKFFRRLGEEWQQVD